jgi:hypothetical protein
MTDAASRHAQAFWITAPGHGELRPAVLPVRAQDKALVRTLFSGISRGTETLVFSGRVPASQYGVMRCPFQEGDFPGPVKYGYSAVGLVEAGPPALAGRLVFCLHPHQDRFVVAADALTPLPAGLPAARAVLAANMETALNAVWDAGIGPGDRVAVVGAGAVGLLASWLAAGIPGVSVRVIDPDSGKAAVAHALGASFITAPSAGDDVFDVVLHASGNPAGLAAALSLAGCEATVVELSWFGTEPVTLPLGENFHSRRLVLRSSQVGRIPPSRQPRWTYVRRRAAALSLLADPRLDCLITGESAFAQLPETMRRLAEGSLPALCHRIRY